MAVAARVVGDIEMLAGVTTQNMTPQCRAAALLNGRHDLQLSQAQVRTLRLTPRRAMGAEDIRDLQ
jgi:hypothetical protein